MTPALRAAQNPQKMAREIMPSRRQGRIESCVDSVRDLLAGDREARVAGAREIFLRALRIFRDADARLVAHREREAASAVRAFACLDEEFDALCVITRDAAAFEVVQAQHAARVRRALFARSPEKRVCARRISRRAAAMLD